MDFVERIVGPIKKKIAHLHVHTIYSLLDGYNFPKKIAKRAKELGMTHLAITDHNHVGGVLDFQQACKENDIMPILGCEMYWTKDTNILSLPIDDRREWAIQQARNSGYDIDQAIYDIEHPVSEKTGKPLKPRKITKTELNSLVEPYEYNTKQYHIILLAINQEGWNNLVKLQSESSAKCTFNGRFCCDNEMLAKYNKGLIMTTACIGNIVPNLIMENKVDEAEEMISSWYEIFGDRFFLEIQPLIAQKQMMTNLHYMVWAKRHNIKVVATTDCHYTVKEDHDDHDSLLCMGIGKAKDDLDRMRYTNDYWLRSYDEMVEAFETQTEEMNATFGDMFDNKQYEEMYLEALDNTNVIADMVEDIKLGSNINLFPNIDIPHGMTAESYLTMRCYQNLYAYKKKHQDINLKIYEKRLKEELNVINTKGFAPYILVVEDYIRWANANGCPTGPGRGSGAGSLVLFMLGITKIIDPIKFNLLFFRFLTMDRTAPPDIDTDFEYYNRERVIQYLEEKYGKQCVSRIGNYSELGVKSGLKDVGRILNIPFDVINNLSKKVAEWSDKPELYFDDLDKLKNSSRDFERAAYDEFQEYETQYPELFRLARKFEGVKRNFGIHASGVLITPMPVTDLFPTRTADGTTITLYTGVQLEDLKAIKFDILGLRTLSVIKNTLKAIDENLTMDDLYEMVDPEDEEIYNMIQTKATEGLFQIESNLFKGMIEEIIPTSMNDIVVINALGRPGPLKAGMPKAYALRKNGEEDSIEPLPGTWDVVKDTYGTIAYQEQIMIIAKIVAGFDDNQADSYLRKAFAKKKKDKMIMCRQWFIYGKINKEAPEGYDKNNKDQPDYDPKGKCGPAIKGGIANGYDEKLLVDFWSNIEGFADYLFNKSHAACYAYICILTAWLKKYYPAKFLAALLSVQSEAEKIDLYSTVARKMGIPVRVPDINMSAEDFSEVQGAILYGLRSVKGVGQSSIPAIIANRPYNGIENAINKIEKKSFNKRVSTALIKAGAFNFENENRYEVLNHMYDYRKDDDERLNPEQWNEDACMELEKEVLGTTITYVPWWDSVNEGDEVTVELELSVVSEKMDKNGNMMAFATGVSQGCRIRAIIFARQYCKNADKFDKNYYDIVVLKGKKDGKGTLVVSKVVDAHLKDKDLEERFESVV
jgi:DNA polymerase-3 subunit alpha